MISIMITPRKARYLTNLLLRKSQKFLHSDYCWAVAFNRRLQIDSPFHYPDPASVVPKID